MLEIQDFFSGLTAHVQAQLGWWAGLVASVAGALVSQSDLLGEPWKHYATVTFIISTAISGFMLRSPSNPSAKEPPSNG